ncbi:Diacylglycerol O-acyltransferase 2 [Rhynchospora pubera]|uniref:Acyltransferase n=1 Tax=Rhynchospora pubera TaxID=906938 RepID=A0AAV8CCG1_9POAL|nr:Diacylglycerol O-acyltransferase 2 [Rhynchospora pubera]
MGEKNGERKEIAKAGKKPPLFKSVIALFLWLGMVQFNLGLLVSAFFLPLRIGILIPALLVLLRLIPINRNSKFGSKVARFIAKNAYGYFPVTVHIEDEKAFDPDQAYVFGYEPHTIIGLGAWALTDRAGYTPFPRIKFLASSLAFNIPIMRHIWTWLGLFPVTRKSFVKQLSAGNSCIVVPGGMQEMLYLEPDSEVAFLKSRKGFVKLAIEMGCPLVPVFCFGQNQVYKWWKPKGKISHTLYKAIKYPPVLSWGRLGSAIPFRVPLNIVIGKPIPLKKNNKPTIEEVNEMHTQFVAVMQELFEKNKAQFGSKDLQLRLL